MSLRIVTYIMLWVFIIATLTLVATGNIEDLHGATIIVSIAVGYFVEKKWKKK